jgi:hypothetical protein
MALTQSDKNEIEKMIRKEIKDFMGTTTIKKFEDTLIDRIRKEIKSGNIRGDINEVIVKIFTEFYYLMWSKRTQWVSNLKNVK